MTMSTMTLHLRPAPKNQGTTTTTGVTIVVDADVTLTPPLTAQVDHLGIIRGLEAALKTPLAK